MYKNTLAKLEFGDYTGDDDIDDIRLWRCRELMENLNQFIQLENLCIVQAYPRDPLHDVDAIIRRYKVLKSLEAELSMILLKATIFSPATVESFSQCTAVKSDLKKFTARIVNDDNKSDNNIIEHLLLYIKHKFPHLINIRLDFGDCQEAIPISTAVANQFVQTLATLITLYTILELTALTLEI